MKTVESVCRGVGASLAVAVATAVVLPSPAMAQFENLRLPGAATQSENSRSTVPSLESMRKGAEAESARSKIIGGEAARFSNNPWQVGLFLVDGEKVFQYCGGSMIAPDWVVTAAHCAKANPQPERVVILSGTDTIGGSGGAVSLVDRIAIHPDYDAKPIDSDIALMHISRQADPLKGQPVAGPDSGAEPMLRFMPMRVTGWGRTVGENASSGSVNLLSVDLPYVTDDSCRQVFGNLTPNMICAGYADSAEGSCKGDSGGPLTVEFNGSRRLIGIVSFGKKGCVSYSVFTRVSRFTDWVNRTTGGAVKWQ